MRTLIHLTYAISLFSSVSCEKPGAYADTMEPKHALEGGWLADDGTVFLFRPDGTFHGYDFRHREIWGNWVSLSKERIGFQSLLHDSFYNPQYALVDPTDKEQMDYIVTGGTHFIRAERISAGEADAAIQMVVKPRIHHPKRAESVPGD